MSEQGIGTKCVQAGYTPGNGEPRQIPIVQSTTFKYDTSEDMGKLFDLEAEGYFYTRLQNPTNDYVAAKIAAGKRAQRTMDFMIVARIESLIAGAGLEDALMRARVYVTEGGADAIMIHSKDASGEDITAFMEAFKVEFPEVPVVLVPTTYNHLTEGELARRGASIIIHANHLLRASYLAMRNAAESILEHERSKEADSFCLPIKDVLTLIPEE